MIKKLLPLLFTFCLQTTWAQNTFVTNIQPGNWSDTAIWSNNKLPTSQTIVKLQYDVVVDIDAQCYALKLNSNNLTIKGSSRLSINGDYKFRQDSLVEYSIKNVAGRDTLLATYFLDSLKYFFHGQRGNDGNIKQITSCDILTNNSDDTSVVCIYDDSLRITASYRLINGVPDTLLALFDYVDSMIIFSTCAVDWNAGTIRSGVTELLKNDAKAHEILGRVMSPLSTGNGLESIPVGALSVEVIFFGSLVLGAIVGGGVGWGVGAFFGLASEATFNLALYGFVIGALAPSKSQGATEPSTSLKIPVNSRAHYDRLIKLYPDLKDLNFTVTKLPVIGTLVPYDIEIDKAASGGYILRNGRNPVISRGVCWNTSGSPTIADTKTINGSGNGAFTSTLSGLKEETLYFVRAYATNAVGTSYGREYKFKTKPKSLLVGSWDYDFSADDENGNNILDDPIEPYTDGGYVFTENGGGSYTEKGYLWSVSWKMTGVDTIRIVRTGQPTDTKNYLIYELTDSTLVFRDLEGDNWEGFRRR